MIQQFTHALKAVWKLNDKYIILAIILLGIILYQLFKRYPLSNRDDINQLLNNIIDFSGIFSAILITFIISKVIQIRQEKLERKKEIIRFANKTTDFRRIARVLINCYGFWDSETRDTINNKYKSINFFDIHLHNYDGRDKRTEKDKLIEAFHQERKLCGAYLYLDMKSLVLEDYQPIQLELYDRYNHDFTYEFEIIEKWHDVQSGNNLWYCLENEWSVYKGCFDFSAIRQHEQEEIVALCKKINPEKYQNTTFSKDLLASIGSEFIAYILPQLYRLTYWNTLGLPKPLKFLLTILFLTMLSGVLTPLLLSSMDIQNKTLFISSSIAVSVLSLSLFYFLFKFKNILNTEIEI